MHIPPGAYDENDWSIDEVSVFFQSGGSVKPRSTVLAEQAAREAGTEMERERPGRLRGKATWAGQAASPLAMLGDGPPFGRFQVCFHRQLHLCSCVMSGRIVSWLSCTGTASGRDRLRQVAAAQPAGLRPGCPLLLMMATGPARS